MFQLEKRTFATREELNFEPWEYESQMPARRKSELIKSKKVAAILLDGNKLRDYTKIFHYQCI